VPYIKPQQREKLASSIENLAKAVEEVVSTQEEANVAGLLNYTITEFLIEVLEKDFIEKVNYHRHNEIIGMLESCKLEWYRRNVAPYEDEKIKQNGDVTWTNKNRGRTKLKNLVLNMLKYFGISIP
jgi:hypothetical protein